MTEYRSRLKERILDVAMPMFRQRGIKAVKMDEIAAALSISKRTLYEIYDNKEGLLLEGVKRSREAMERHLEHYAATAHNEMEIIVEFLRVQMSDLQDVSSAYISDINRYQKVIAYLRSNQDEHRKKSGEFTRRGVENGYFITHINYDVFAILSDAMAEYVMNTRLYERFPLKDVMHTMVSILVRGCCTEKGIKILDEAL